MCNYWTDTCWYKDNDLSAYYQYEEIFLKYLNAQYIQIIIKLKVILISVNKLTDTSDFYQLVYLNYILSILK